MTDFKKLVLLATVSGSAIIFSTPFANAQDAATDTAAEEDDSRRLETITVTAEKRSENLQTVPISVTAFSGDNVRQFGFDDSTDIAAQVPGLNIGTPVGEGNNPAIVLRGVGLNDFNDNNESPVSIYNDGVYVGASAAQTFQLFDLERVEVLRGPQGTLFGRNATGGLIQFIAAKPTDEFEARTTVSFGSYSEVKTETAISGPITEGVRARVSVATNNRDGFVENLIAEDGNETDSVAIRGQLDFDIGDRGGLLLRGDYVQSDVAAGRIEQQATGSIFNEVFGLPLVDNFGFAELDDDPFTVSQDRSGNVLDLDNYNIAATFDYELTDAITFTSISAFSETERLYQEDTDAGPFPGIEADFLSDTRQFTQEVRFNGDHGRFRWQGGAFYLTSEVEGQLDVQVNQPIEFVDFLDDLPGAAGGFEGGLSGVLNGGVPFINGGLFDFTGATFTDPSRGAFNVDPNLATVPISGIFVPFINFDADYDQDTDSFSFFYQFDYDLTDRLTFTGGIRYTNEDRDIQYINAARSGNIINDFFGTPGVDPTAPPELQIFELLGSTAGNFFDFTDAGLAARGLDTELNNISNDAVTGRAVLEFQATEETLFYASYNRGFKSAGFNTGFLDATDGVTVDLAPYDEETLDSYEVGLKTTFGNGRYRFNASGFYYNYDDFQVFSFLGLSQFISNADATYFGGEIEATASLFEGFDVHLAASYLDTDVDGVQDLNAGAVLNNQTSVLSPEFSVNGYARYERPAFGGLVYGLVDFNWQDEQFFDITNSDISREGSYALVNLRLAYQGGDEHPYELAFFVNNIADKEYRAYTFDFTGAAGFNQQFFGPPRWFGGSLTFEF